MKVSLLDREKRILQEFGKRIKQHRISLNMTQYELSKKCGFSLSTLIRVENGDDPQWSTIIKILTEFNLLENLDLLIPESKPDYKALFEERKTRKRARPTPRKEKALWIWQEDKEEDTP